MTGTHTSHVKVETTAQAFLELLAHRGVDCFFANAGTDFASIADAFAMRAKMGMEKPRPITVPHEIPLVSMAHGYYLATGRPQAAMVHVGVGTANALGPILAASRSRIPMLFAAGRTPITEQGTPASRSAFIHWGQESFDQAAMLREYVKWDYELRTPEQLEAVVDRALAIAQSEPQGPVYLTLPREIISSPMEEFTFSTKHRYDLPRYYPDPRKIEEAADILINAEFPIIITSSSGRSADAVHALSKLAGSEAIGVVCFNPEYMNLPLEHPCHQGFWSGALVTQADAILVLECDVPWYPKMSAPKPSTVVIQAGIDPFYSHYPVRSFPSDLTVQGEPALVIDSLAAAMAAHPRRDSEAVARRLDTLRSSHDRMLSQWREDAHSASLQEPLEVPWVSHTIGKVFGDEAIIVNEYDNGMKENMGSRPDSYFGISHVGWLGWALGSSLGIKLARKDSFVVATVGDGCYLFSVPTACHLVSSALSLPFLTVVYNNQSWHAVKRATLGMHPDGWAARTGTFPLSELTPAPDYEKICEAFGGYGQKVTDPNQVQTALERAREVVTVEKRQAVINMVCKPA